MTSLCTFNRLLIALLALALVAGACGREDDEDGGGSSDTTVGGSTESSGTTTGSGEEGVTGPASSDGCDGYEASPGVTDSTITLGTSYPVSGLFSALGAIADGWRAHLEVLNDTGGVAGRQVEVVELDDEYQPANTARNYQRLVDEEGVFALFSLLGTPNNLGIQPQQNAACVPNLFAATGSQLLAVPSEYPWTIGSIPSYPLEMAVFTEVLKRDDPDAQVAFLYQDDDFGSAYIDTFRGLTEGTDISVVAESTYTPDNLDVSGQMTDLASSGADTLVLAVASLACPGSLGALAEQAGWDPLTYISATCTSGALMGLAPPGSGDGVMSAFYLKDPADPQWDDDPAMVEFLEQGAAAGLSGEQLDNGIVAYGWMIAEVLAHTIETAPEVTRLDVMNTAYHIDGLEVGLLLPGIKVTTNGVEDPHLIESMYVGSFNGEYWDLEDELVSFEGESTAFVP